MKLLMALLVSRRRLASDRKELGKYVMAAPPRVTEALAHLESSKVRQIVKLPTGKFRLTDLGSKYIRENLADKLLIQ